MDPIEQIRSSDNIGSSNIAATSSYNASSEAMDTMQVQGSAAFPGTSDSHSNHLPLVELLAASSGQQDQVVAGNYELLDPTGHTIGFGPKVSSAQGREALAPADMPVKLPRSEKAPPLVELLSGSSSQKDDVLGDSFELLDRNSSGEGFTDFVPDGVPIKVPALTKELRPLANRDAWYNNQSTIYLTDAPHDSKTPLTPDERRSLNAGIGNALAKDFVKADNDKKDRDTSIELFRRELELAVNTAFHNGGQNDAAQKSVDNMLGTVNKAAAPEYVFSVEPARLGDNDFGVLSKTYGDKFKVSISGVPQVIKK